MTRLRLTPAERRRRILDVAIPMAEAIGFNLLTRKEVADAAGVSHALMSLHWTADQFQDAIMEESVRQRNLIILAQGIVANHPAALAAPYDLRRQAVNDLLE